jgi:hypothetical protein
VAVTEDDVVAGPQPDPADSDATPAEPAAAGAGGRRDRWLLVVAFALVVAPLAVSAVSLAVSHRSYMPTGDLAATELLTRDVGHRWLELGPFSRDGWFHPGPALFYVLAGPYRATGGASIALPLAALAVNGASVAGMAVVAKRRAGTAAALTTLVACALLLRALDPDQLRVPWNPWVTVLPYGLVLFLAWAMTGGERWALPIAAGVAIFVAQTHVGYVALAFPLVALGAVWLVVAPGPGGRRRLAAPGLATLGVLAVMWLPPVAQQALNGTGNLGLTLRWFRDGGPRGERPAGLRTGWRVVSSQYGLPPEWLLGARDPGPTPEPAAIGHPLVPILLVLVAAAAVVLWRRKVAGGPQLVVVWLVASVVGVVATARTVGPVYAYRMAWTWVLAMVAGVIVAWAAWTLLASWRPGLERRALVPASVVALAVLAVATSVGMVQAGDPDPVATGRMRELLPQVTAAIPEGDGQVVVDGPMLGSASYAAGLELALEKAGYDARVLGNTTGPARVADDGPRRARLLIATDIDIATAADDPNLRLVAYAGDYPLDELRSRVPATQALNEAFTTGRTDDLDEIVADPQFIGPDDAVAVFLAPLDPAPPG